jgi:hypothetical protein
MPRSVSNAAACPIYQTVSHDNSVAVVVVSHGAKPHNISPGAIRTYL